MAKCPSCGKDIDHLYLDVIEKNRFDVYLIKEEVVYDSIDYATEEPTKEFECPECREIVAESDEEAEDILKSDIIEENITE